MAGNMRGTEPAPTHAPAPAPRTAEAVEVTAAAQASAENFPVALRVLPARYRRHLMALYGFARLTDDIGDEAPPRASGCRLLDELDADVHAHLRRRPAPQLAVDAGAGADGGAVRASRHSRFVDLIQANRQDQLVTRYETFEDLVGYCGLSANPVGRMVLHIFGAATPARARCPTGLHRAAAGRALAGRRRGLRPGPDLPAAARTWDSSGSPRPTWRGRSAGPRVRALLAFETRAGGRAARRRARRWSARCAALRPAGRRRATWPAAGPR